MLLATRRRPTATLLLLTLLAWATVVPALADGNTTFSGRVFGTSASEPEAGVVVALVEPTTERVYSSEPSAADGTFRVDGAPAGTYRLVAETPRGAYLADAPVEVTPGGNRPVALALGGTDPAYQTTQDPTGQAQGDLPAWAKWTIVGGIAVLGLLAIDSLTDDESEEAPVSPSILGPEIDR
ncbi:MAG TPA: carboxypeptidase-like regulatory domain-containing protein [Candidatus Polarisedimenticolaceae bacterium]|nr:carboxypeptidase-like regulatory domain-containing protein [Candidatus Polarisedimenticolaceae bacterium]